MKRKRADRPDWRRILAHEFLSARIEVPAFHGVVALYAIERVREPLYKPIAGVQTLLADDGFRWLQMYSDLTRSHTVTAMYDTQGQVVQWYIDVCSGHGVDHRGVPWHDDLYLDVIASERRIVEILDVDELEAAFESYEPNAPQWSAYHHAWREAHRLACMVSRGALPEMRFAPAAFDAMQALMAGSSVQGARVLNRQPNGRGNEVDSSGDDSIEQTHQQARQ